MKFANILKPIAIIILLVLIELAFLTHVVPIAYENIRSADWDQAAYLKLGLQIAYRLALTDGSRPPLYTGMLSLFAQQKSAYFTTAKYLSLVIGGVGLLIIYGITRCFVSAPGALFITLLMAFNAEYQYAAAFVDVEVLFTPLFFLTWYCTGRAAQAITQDQGDALKWGFIAGLMVGLLYQAKGTATLLALAFAFTVFVLQGPACLAQKTTWAFGGAFALVALPLWIYNAQNFGSPLYNINTTHYLWLDNWGQRFIYGEDSALPTALTYLQTHTPGEIFTRLTRGLLNSPTQWHNAARPVGVFSSENPWAIWGSTVLGLLTLILVAQNARQAWHKRRSWFLYTLSALGLFWLSFAWYYAVSDAARFISPWVPVLYLALLWGVKNQLAAPKLKGPILQSILVAVCVAILVFTLSANLHTLALLPAMPNHDRVAGEASLAFIQSVIARTKPGEAYILGPTHAQAEWMAFDRCDLRIPQVRQDWYSFNTWLVDRDVRTIILDQEMWKRRQPLLSQYWQMTEVGLTPQYPNHLPLGWSLVKPEAFPCNPCLFHFDARALEPAQKTDVQYNNQVELLGYTLEMDTVPADTAWSLTLYWRLLSSVTKDTHAFVHILNDQGELVAQHDSAVVAGKFPNYDLQAGTIIPETHPLPPLQPGHYTVHIGLYDWATQARLQAIQDGHSVPENSPKILGITVE